MCRKYHIAHCIDIRIRSTCNVCRQAVHTAPYLLIRAVFDLQKCIDASTQTRDSGTKRATLTTANTGLSESNTPSAHLWREKTSHIQRGWYHSVFIHLDIVCMNEQSACTSMWVTHNRGVQSMQTRQHARYERL